MNLVFASGTLLPQHLLGFNCFRRGTASFRRRSGRAITWT